MSQRSTQACKCLTTIAPRNETTTREQLFSAGTANIPRPRHASHADGLLAVRAAQSKRGRRERQTRKHTPHTSTLRVTRGERTYSLAGSSRSPDLLSRRTLRGHRRCCIPALLASRAYALEARDGSFSVISVFFCVLSLRDSVAEFCFVPWGALAGPVSIRASRMREPIVNAYASAPVRLKSAAPIGGRFPRDSPIARRRGRSSGRGRLTEADFLLFFVLFLSSLLFPVVFGKCRLECEKSLRLEHQPRELFSLFC